MNDMQRKIVVGVIVGIVTAFAFPPHAIFSAKWGIVQWGYSFIANIPENHSIHVAMLSAEWIGIAAIGALLFYIAKKRN